MESDDGKDVFEKEGDLNPSMGDDNNVVILFEIEKKKAKKNIRTMNMWNKTNMKFVSTVKPGFKM